jgi:hypothetical protein
MVVHTQYTAMVVPAPTERVVATLSACGRDTHRKCSSSHIKLRPPRSQRKHLYVIYDPTDAMVTVEIELKNSL